MKVYDPQGVEHDKEAVDVRELVAEQGWTKEPKLPEPPKEAEKEPTTGKKGK